MFSVDLASEMAAARQRRTEQTAQLLREARVQTIRSAVRPGATRTDIEECARSFYPRLRVDLVEEAVNLVCQMQRIPQSEAAPADAPQAEAAEV
ncbi:hypothetical protein BH23GEM3_BH23GEM3_23480 [soil metagenome]